MFWSQCTKENYLNVFIDDEYADVALNAEEKVAVKSVETQCC